MFRRNEKKLYSLTKQGQIEFGNSTRLNKERFKPDSIWTNPVVLIGIMALCAVAEFASFSQMFGSFLDDNPNLRYVATTVFLLTFEISPIYLGYNLKKLKQGYNINSFLCIGLGVAFAVLALANIVLRVVTKDLVFPDVTGYSASAVWGISQQTTAVSSNAIYYAIVFSLMPIISSLVCFLVSFTMADSLKQDLVSLEKQKTMILNETAQLKSTVEEYFADENFLNRTLDEDRKKCEAAAAIIINKRNAYSHNVKSQIIGHLGTPTDNSALSKADYPEKSSKNASGFLSDSEPEIRLFMNSLRTGGKPQKSAPEDEYENAEFEDSLKTGERTKKSYHNDDQRSHNYAEEEQATAFIRPVHSPKNSDVYDDAI